MLNMKSKIFKYIYAMLCLLPAIAVGVTCVYVANNENAYQSYSGLNNNTSSNIVVTSTTDFDFSKTYYLTNSLQYGTPPSNSSAYTYFDSVDVVINNTSTSDDVIEQFDRMYIYSTGSTLFYNFYYGNTNVTLNSGNDFLIKVKIRSFSGNDSAITQLNYNLSNSSSLYYIDYFTEQQLDNVFYYSLDKVENSSVFSWVKSNFLYSGVNQFVGIFGGTNSNISFYLTWVLTISLCYLGFEVLMLFINLARNLIHSFTDKDRW